MNAQANLAGMKAAQRGRQLAGLEPNPRLDARIAELSARELTDCAVELTQFAAIARQHLDTIGRANYVAGATLATALRDLERGVAGLQAVLLELPADIGRHAINERLES